MFRKRLFQSNDLRHSNVTKLRSFLCTVTVDDVKFCDGLECVYVTRHDSLCPNAVKRDVGKTRCKSDVIYATVLCCAIC